MDLLRTCRMYQSSVDCVRAGLDERHAGMCVHAHVSTMALACMPIPRVAWTCACTRVEGLPLFSRSRRARFVPRKLREIMEHDPPVGEARAPSAHTAHSPQRWLSEAPAWRTNSGSSQMHIMHAWVKAHGRKSACKDVSNLHELDRLAFCAGLAGAHGIDCSETDYL
jgi:hypothetical protein